MNEHTKTGRRMLVAIGQAHNRTHVLLEQYDGPWAVCSELIAAIVAHLDVRYSGSGWKAFDYVEIMRMT